MTLRMEWAVMIGKVEWIWALGLEVEILFTLLNGEGRRGDPTRRCW